jgi:hypothetical protein
MKAICGFFNYYFLLSKDQRTKSTEIKTSDIAILDCSLFLKAIDQETCGGSFRRTPYSHLVS